MARSRASGLLAECACVQRVPSHSHVSARKAVPRDKLPPNITTFPDEGSKAIVVQSRPGGPPATTAWRVQVLPSNVQVMPSACWLKTTIVPFVASYAAAEPALGPGSSTVG